MTPMEQSERKGLVDAAAETARILTIVGLGSDRFENPSEATGKLVQLLNDMATLLSSDARPAPMADEVKASMTSLSELFAEPETDEDYQKNWADVAAHIDDLTRKVAEAGAVVKIVWPFFEGEHSYDHPDSVRVRALLASVRPKQEGV